MLCQNPWSEYTVSGLKHWYCMLNAFLFQWTHITDAQTQCSGIAYNLNLLPIGMVTPGLTIFVEKKDDVFDMHWCDVHIKINWHITLVLGQ